MNYKYNCDLCNYHTHRKYNFIKHNTTKKHTKLIALPGSSSENSESSSEKSGNSSKKSKKKMICNKTYSRKDNLKQHYKICKNKLQLEKINKILNDKKKLEQKYIKSKKKIKELKTDYEEIKTDYEEIEKEYDIFHMNIGKAKLFQYSYEIDCWVNTSFFK